MVIKSDRTKDFLKNNGIKLEINDIKVEKGHIAVIDILGGFFSFRCAGIDEGILGRVYFFKNPNVVYYAEINYNDIDSESEGWDLTSEGDYWNRWKLLNIGTLDRGVYKLTSQDIIDRIDGVLADSTKKSIKYSKYCITDKW